MDILIKSFNRPYYLDRCIFSIKKNCNNFDGKIIVLDDGTPQKYLDKILKKHPEITILKSEFYTKKSTAIDTDLVITNANIPINLWINTASTATDYFLLLEDDIWFTSSIDLNELVVTLQDNKVQMLKLLWLGNPKLITDRIVKQFGFFKTYQVKLFTTNTLIYKFIFKYYKYKIRKTATFFNLYTKERELQYYTIYSVAGAVFNKNYFLNLWKNHKNTVDEKLQIVNALQFINKNKNAQFGNSNQEVLKTSFLSAATNEHKKYNDVTIDMFVFNKIINQAWFNDTLDTTTNLQDDINTSEIETVLEKVNHPLAQKTEWNKWVIQFKKQYTSKGCKID